MKNKDIIVGSLILVFGIFVMFMIPSQIEDAQSVAVGPRAFPYFCGILLILCSIVLLIQGIRQGNSEERNEEKLDKGNILFALAFYLTVVLYAVLMHHLGFLMTSFVFLPTLMIMLGVRKKVFYILLIPIILIVYYVFQIYLHVQLP